MASDFEKGIISLIRSAVGSETAVLPDCFDWNEVIKVANKHQTAPLLYYGIHKSGIRVPDDIVAILKRESYAAAIVNECQNCELLELFRAFAENNIEYMPLKGVLLKRLYPNPDMRIMSDADILINVEQYEAISDILKRLGYFVEAESDPEVKWSKPPIMIIELHKRLFSPKNRDYYAYFGDGWRLARRSESDQHLYEMRAEDQLVYLFTHFAKHYRNGGIGIKHLVDFWIIFNKHRKLNSFYIQEQLTKLQLYQFYRNILYTLDVWFCGTASNDISDFITRHIFSSGAYGAREEKMVASIVKNLKSAGSASSAQTKEILKIVFLPYLSMCRKYTILKQVPVLLPVFWVIRLARIIFFEREKIKKQRADMSIMSVENINRYHNDLNYVGLNFNFRE